MSYQCANPCGFVAVCLFVVVQLPPGEALPMWVQTQTTYAVLKKEEEGHWGLQVLKQKIWVKGVSYELQEIYGMEQNRAQANSSVRAEDVDGRECVICMSAERDTTVLPCRHMCMCQECAAALKTQTNKCPICRMEIESLLHIKIQQKGAGANGAAGAGSTGALTPQGSGAQAGVPGSR
jgi:E3 ubiquitin-protein ligase MGRN1